MERDACDVGAPGPDRAVALRHGRNRNADLPSRILDRFRRPEVQPEARACIREDIGDVVIMTWRVQNSSF